MRLAAGLLADAVLLVGCGILPASVPEWVANRQPLESCGEETDQFNQVARTCLLEAFESGRAAEIVSTQTTIEGDPITRFIRVHENGVIEIFVDATRDRFGSGEWERVRCETLNPVAMANDPQNPTFPDEMVFVENGCEELPVP